MTIKAICFDLDGVYFTDSGKKHFIKKLVESGADEEKAKYAFAKSPQMNEQYKIGRISTDEYWNFMNNELKINLSDEEYERFLVDGYEVDSLAQVDVKKVRSMGIKTCICSSNFEARVRKLQEKFGFLDDFDIKVFTHLVGLNKPDPKLYLELIKQTGFKPEEIVYADDKQEAVDSAQSVGINAIFVNSYSEYKEYLVKLGINL